MLQAELWRGYQAFFRELTKCGFRAYEGVAAFPSLRWRGSLILILLLACAALARSAVFLFHADNIIGLNCAWMAFTLLMDTSR